MTENKRFTIQGVGISDHERKRLYDLETVDGFISVRDLLNELNDENEQLKHDATVLICSNQEYRKENEQLKKDNFKAFALLGDIRALLRTNSYDTVIEKINKFEKEVLK